MKPRICLTEGRVQFADVLAGPPLGLQQDSSIELVVETGNCPMQWTCPLKRLSKGELADSELHSQLTDLLDSWWIQD